MAASEVPIMCTLPPDTMVRRLREFAVLFAEALTKVEREPLRLRLTFDAGREATVREMVAAEQRCCAFLGYAVQRTEAGLVVEVTAPEDAGLAGRARAKPAEVERRIADLEAVRSTLREAVGAGCDDLLACAAEPCCPLPFAEPARPGARAERRP